MTTTESLEATARHPRRRRPGNRGTPRHGAARHGGRRALGQAVAALASAAIVGAAVLFVVAPTTVALAVSVQARVLAPARHAKVPAHREVLYGRVENVVGAPLRGASILVIERVGRRERVVARIRTGRNGTYRRSLLLRRGRYVLELEARISGRIITKVRAIVLVPGHAYEASARATARRLFSILPVGSY